MSGAHVTKTEAILEKIALWLKAQQTTLRRCLCCESWMHSTGPDHRLCNPCKGEPDYRKSLVGQRLNVAGRREGVTLDVAMERSARMVEAFASGESIDELAERTGLERATVEAVIRQAMKLADRNGLKP